MVLVYKVISEMLKLLLCVVSVNCLDPVTLDLATPMKIYGEGCGYDICPNMTEGYLNVHIIPTMHAEYGYWRTFEQHYSGRSGPKGFMVPSSASMKKILDNVVTELWDNKERTFAFSDFPFFFRWWGNRDSTVRRKVYQLLRQGRLHFIGGGWTMTDETSASYHAIIDHYTFSLRKLNSTFLRCGLPLVTWQSDVFGHSREFASLMAQMGFDAHFIHPISYDDELNRMRNRELEFIWRGSDDLGPPSDIFTHKLFDGYSPPPGFCFGSHCKDPLLADTDEANVEERTNAFIQALLQRQAPFYNTGNIMVTMGTRTGYHDAARWFSNIDTLIKSVNTKQSEMSKNNKVILHYSSPACYLKAVSDTNTCFPVKQDDFIPYAYDSHTFATGMYTSRPSLKTMVRESTRYLQMAKQIRVTAMMWDQNVMFENMQWITGVLQDHNLLPGSMASHVFDFYTDLIHVTTASVFKYISQGINKVRRSPRSKQYHRCNFYISDCTFTDQAKSVIVIYNSLAWPVTKPVRLPTTLRDYTVVSPSGENIPCAVMKIPVPIASIPERESISDHELVFIAEDIPPLGYRSFFIEVKKHTVAKRAIIKKLYKKISRKFFTENNPETNEEDQKTLSSSFEDCEEAQTAEELEHVQEDTVAKEDTTIYTDTTNNFSPTFDVYDNKPKETTPEQHSANENSNGKRYTEMGEFADHSRAINQPDDTVYIKTSQPGKPIVIVPEERPFEGSITENLSLNDKITERKFKQNKANVMNSHASLEGEPIVYPRHVPASAQKMNSQTQFAVFDIPDTERNKEYNTQDTDLTQKYTDQNVKPLTSEQPAQQYNFFHNNYKGEKTTVLEPNLIQKVKPLTHFEGFEPVDREQNAPNDTETNRIEFDIFNKKLEQMGHAKKSNKTLQSDFFDDISGPLKSPKNNLQVPNYFILERPGVGGVELNATIKTDEDISKQFIVFQRENHHKEHNESAFEQKEIIPTNMEGEETYILPVTDIEELHKMKSKVDQETKLHEDTFEPGQEFKPKKDKSKPNEEIEIEKYKLEQAKKPQELQKAKLSRQAKALLEQEMIKLKPLELEESESKAKTVQQSVKEKDTEKLEELQESKVKMEYLQENMEKPQESKIKMKDLEVKTEESEVKARQCVGKMEETQKSKVSTKDLEERREEWKALMKQPQELKMKTEHLEVKPEESEMTTEEWESIIKKTQEIKDITKDLAARREEWNTKMEEPKKSKVRMEYLEEETEKSRELKIKTEDSEVKTEESTVKTEQLDVKMEEPTKLRALVKDSEVRREEWKAKMVESEEWNAKTEVPQEWKAKMEERQGLKAKIEEPEVSKFQTKDLEVKTEELELERKETSESDEKSQKLPEPEVIPSEQQSITQELFESAKINKIKDRHQSQQTTKAVVKKTDKHKIKNSAKQIPAGINEGHEKKLIIKGNVDKMVENEAKMTNQPNDSTEKNIKNKYVTIAVDSSTDKITSVELSNGIQMSLDIQFFIYASDDPAKFGRKQNAPGAFIFRPVDPHPVAILDFMDIKIYKSNIVEEIHYEYANYVSFVVRLYADNPVIEMQWVVGPVQVHDNIGKEVFVRYKTDIMNNGAFYTDANGRQTIKRIRNKRMTYETINSQPVASNLYPVTSKIYITDPEKNIRFSVFTDRPQGGTSLKDGEIDLMLHRRLLTDDNSPFAFLNETISNNNGLIVIGTHYLYISKNNQKQYKIFEKKLSKEIEFKPTIFVSEVSANSALKSEWNTYKNEFTPLKSKLPIGVHLLTLEKWDGGKLLIRLENYLEKEDVIKSGVKHVSLADLFADINIVSIRETTLAAHIWLDERKRIQWCRNGRFFKNTNEAYDKTDVELEYLSRDEELEKETLDVATVDEISLVPQQIRTFVADFVYKI